MTAMVLAYNLFRYKFKYLATAQYHVSAINLSKASICISRGFKLGCRVLTHAHAYARAMPSSVLLTELELALLGASSPTFQAKWERYRGCGSIGLSAEVSEGFMATNSRNHSSTSAFTVRRNDSVPGSLQERQVLQRLPPPCYDLPGIQILSVSYEQDYLRL